MIYYTAIRTVGLSVTVVQVLIANCRQLCYSAGLVCGHFWATFLCYTCQLAHGESVLAIVHHQMPMPLHIVRGVGVRMMRG